MICRRLATTRQRDAEGDGVPQDDARRSRDPENIVLRQVDIEFDLPPDQPWFPRSEITECMLSAFSFMLPPGERFFIESVRAYADLISEPVLKEQVRRFIYQEAMHSREHDAANSLLQQHYTRGAAFGRLTARHIAFWANLLPRSWRLAVTCSIEHFTAMAAHTLLRFQIENEPWMKPAFYRLWTWHAVEESEHKSVCFDVYRSCVGTGVRSYLLRTFVFVMTTVLFFVTLVIGLRMLGRRPPGSLPTASPSDDTTEDTADPEPSNPARRARRGSLATLLNHILPWRQYFAYFRPSFHPSDYDCTDYIEKWKARFPDFDGAAPTTPPVA